MVRLGDGKEVQGTWLQVSHTVTVHPRSEALVMAELAVGTHHIGQMGLVEPWPSREAKGLMVGHILVDTRGPMLAVHMLNVYDSPRTVRSRTVVAKCSRVVEVTRGGGSPCLPAQPDEKGNYLARGSPGHEDTL